MINLAPPLNSRTWNTNIGPQWTSHNYIVYQLHGAATSFRAELTPSNHTNVDITYRFYGDGRLLHTSPRLVSTGTPIPVIFNLTGVHEFRIEFEARNSSNNALNFSTDGIRNATIFTTER